MAKSISKGSRSKSQALGPAVAADLKEKAKLLKSLGLYNPSVKSVTDRSLTKGRVERIRSLSRKYEDLLNPSKTTVVKLSGDLARKRAVKGQAKQSGLMATLKAVFVGKKAEIDTARVVKVKGTKRFTIVGTGVDKGTGKELVKQITPLGSTLTVARDLKAIQKLAREEGRKLGPGYELRVVSYGKHLWKRSYSNVDLFLKDLMAYHKNDWAHPSHLKNAGEFSDFVENIEIRVLPDMPWKDAQRRLGLEGRTAKSPTNVPKGFKVKRRVNK